MVSKQWRPSGKLDSPRPLEPFPLLHPKTVPLLLPTREQENFREEDDEQWGSLHLNRKS